MTVLELCEACKTLVENGWGDREIFLNNSGELVGYYPLDKGFTADGEVLWDIAYENEIDANHVILLG